MINDLTIEPKTPEPREKAAGAAETKATKSGPELEREFEKIRRRTTERALRLWAH
ncbi:MAG TPA: hypothetical protein VF883_10985 [Thermoanaerobaculia bacterium]